MLGELELDLGCRGLGYRAQTLLRLRLVLVLVLLQVLRRGDREVRLAVLLLRERLRRSRRALRE